jgi:hypothetical protein
VITRKFPKEPMSGNSASAALRLWLFQSTIKFFAARYHGGLSLRFLSLLLALLPVALAQAALPPVTCPAGAPIGNVDLRIVSPGKDDEPLPLRTINRLSEGDIIRYAPILRSGEKRSGEVSLVLAPAIPESKDQTIIVLDPKPAAKPAEWKVSRRISVAIFVYGPDGLNRGKVKTFLSKDNELVAQLADYAEKTTQTEALIQALSSTDGSPASASAALQGFASQYGLGVKIDKTQPVDQQAMTLFRTVNPAMEGADPLTSVSSQRVGETASIATSIAGLFFGSPVGLAAGGTAMLIDLKMLAFPRTDFRSSIEQKLPSDGMALCGKKGAATPHTKIAYLWASRIPNSGAPTLTIGSENSLPAGQKSPLPVEVSETDWKYVDRVRNWTLVSDQGKRVPITVSRLGVDKGLEIDLSKARVAPGEYHLSANWDWDRFAVNGALHVQPLSSFGSARVDPMSQDHLIAGKGKTRVTLVGSDFEFVTGVQLEKANDEFARPSPLPFVLPEGLRRGPQEHLDLLVDTKDLDPGKYQLFLAQVDGRAHTVPFQVLPNPPSITNLPIIISRGERRREVTLKGENLNLLAKLETAEGMIQLGPALPNQTERTATIQVENDLKPGAAFDMHAFVSGHTEPLTLADAIHVVGPHPAIVDAKVSPPTDMAVQLQPGELAAGVFVSSLLQVKNLEANSGVQLSCEGQEGNVVALHMGEHSSTANLQQLAPDQVFLSFDTNGWPAGCTIQARIDNGPDGISAPCKLGKLVRMPRIETFQITSNEGETGALVGELIGTDLQNIQKVGWDANTGTDVPGLPSPIPEKGMEQSLQINLPGPPPAPQAPLYIWLRGDSTGRLTSAHDLRHPSDPIHTP